MSGLLAIILAFICFLVPMMLPMFTRRWPGFLVLLAVAAVFFGWLTLEMESPGSIPAGIGTFLGGLMLTGFAFGAIARFVMLVGLRRQ